MNEEITIDSIRDWLKRPVTIDFFKRINNEINRRDEKIHFHLSPETANDTVNLDTHIKQASFYNAGMDQLKEVLVIPDIMINELKEDK